jgi:hypothetical protein
MQFGTSNCEYRPMFLSSDNLHMNDWSYGHMAQLLARGLADAFVSPPTPIAGRLDRVRFLLFFAKGEKRLSWCKATRQCLRQSPAIIYQLEKMWTVPRKPFTKEANLQRDTVPLRLLKTRSKPHKVRAAQERHAQSEEFTQEELAELADALGQNDAKPDRHKKKKR